MIKRVMGGLLAMALGASPAAAQDVPNMLPYQGFLADDQGTPIDGSVDLTFRIYESPDAVAPIWEETLRAVGVSTGYFAVNLGRIAPLVADVTAGRTRYLGISVGDDAEATPRQAVGSVPYALVAHDARQLGGQPAALYVTTDQLNATFIERNLVTRDEVEQLVGNAGVDEAAVNGLIDARGYLTTDAINALIDARGYLGQEAILALIGEQGYQTAANVNAAIDARGYVTGADVDARGYLTGADVDGRGYLTAADLDGRGYLNQAQVDARIDGRGYLNQAQVDARIDGRGYLNQAQVDARIDGRGYLNQAQVDTRIDRRGYLSADQIDTRIANAGYLTEADFNRLSAGFVSRAEVQALIANVGAAAQQQIDGLQARIVTLEAGVGQLNNEVDDLETAVANAPKPPFILGVGSRATDGRMAFNGRRGLEAAHALCQDAFAAESTAHMCTFDEVYRALGAEAYNPATRATYDGIATWTVGPVTTGVFNGSARNNCSDFRYNTADIATGTVVTVRLDHQSAGGNALRGHTAEVFQNQSCGALRPVLCCR